MNTDAKATLAYGSVCSGIEAASVAWRPLGWEASFLSEIEPFPRAVLAHHYPHVPLHGDFTTIQKGMYEPIELLVGGTPCQSFSVAGLRAGLDDPRGNLMLEFGALARRLGPKWLVWENVPGVLSSNGGRDFGTFLGMLGQLGYGFAYRVLDAQHFGVPQRRRRVFVVGCLGDWRSAAAVLFERHSLSRNPAPSRGERQEVAGAITAGAFSGGAGGRPEGAAAGHFQVSSTGDIAHCLNAGGMGRQDFETETIISYGIPGNWIGRKPENGGNAVEPMRDVAPCLTKTDQHAVAHTFNWQAGGTQTTLGYDPESHVAGSLIKDQTQAVAYGVAESPDLAHCLRSGASKADKHESTTYIQKSMQVRRLTPIECERLQGFPDDYTLVPFRNKPAADGPRYKALGNSMAVPVMHWIGSRIQMVDAITATKEAA